MSVFELPVEFPERPLRCCWMFAIFAIKWQCAVQTERINRFQIVDLSCSSLATNVQVQARPCRYGIQKV